MSIKYEKIPEVDSLSLSQNKALVYILLEVEMTTHSSILAWEIPWTEELGG